MIEIESIKCPICGADMTNENVMLQTDIGNPMGGKATVNVLTCGQCGSHVEVYECSDNEKQDYKFWSK